MLPRSPWKHDSMCPDLRPFASAAVATEKLAVERLPERIAWKNCLTICRPQQNRSIGQLQNPLSQVADVLPGSGSFQLARSESNSFESIETRLSAGTAPQKTLGEICKVSSL